MTIEFKNIVGASEDLIEVVRNWRNSKQVSRYMITNHYITIEEHQLWIERLRTANTAKAWVIRYGRKPVGIVSLPHIDYIKKSAEWGLYIADETTRGKGIGSAALYKLTEYVFEKLHFNTMTTFVLENNPVAIRMYEKFGFKRDKKRTQQLNRDGKTIDAYYMVMTLDEWNKIKKK